MGGMDVAIQLIYDNIGSPLEMAGYVLAAIIFLFGMGNAVSKFMDDSRTIRDVMPQVALTAIGTGVMVLVAANVESVMG